MRDEGLIWACFFLLVACGSMAKNSDILYAGLPDVGDRMHLTLPAPVSPVAPVMPLPVPDELSGMELLGDPVGCSNIKGQMHFAAVYRDSAGGRGGLYAITSKDGSRWDMVRRVFSDNANAEAGSPAIACDTNEYVRGHKNGFRNRIYLAWVIASTAHSSSQYSQIFFAVSVDGGNLFGVPPLDGGTKWQYYPMRLNVGANAATNPSVQVNADGDVVVSWTETDSKSGATKSVSRRSSSGGAGFMSPQDTN